MSREIKLLWLTEVICLVALAYALARGNLDDAALLVFIGVLIFINLRREKENRADVGQEHRSRF
jgi:hypothetical protein